MKTFIILTERERDRLVYKVVPDYKGFFCSLEGILPLIYDTDFRDHRDGFYLYKYFVTDMKAWMIAKIKYGLSIEEYEEEGV